MKKHILFAIIFFVSIQTQAQTEKSLVNLFMPSTVLIKYNAGGNGSGVFVSDSTYIYLVTARHCLLNQTNNGFSLVDSLAFLIYYIDDAFGGKSDSLLVNLSNAVNERDILFDPVNDIAILTIGKINGITPSGYPLFYYTNSINKLSKIGPGTISQESCINFENIQVGEDCMTIGYPTSLQLISLNDYNFQRPLLRKGAIAGKDKSKGTIIIDSPSYQGNSGGPVFSTSSYDNSNIGLIGIVSRSILQVEELSSNYYKTIVSVNHNNSGYSVIIPIEFAFALMKTKRSLK